jgi:hypothetical protein
MAPFLRIAKVFDIRCEDNKIMGNFVSVGVLNYEIDWWCQVLP